MNNLSRSVFKKHQIGKLFDIHSVSWDQRIYILISLFFYVVQIYQNICSCIRFVKNIKFIHRDLFLIRKHIDDTIIAINDFDLQCTNIQSYEEFVTDLRSQMIVLERFKVDLDNIIPNKLTFTKINNIGQTMKCYYMLHNNEAYKNALQYSYDFWGYIDILNGIKENVNTNYLGKCKFGNKTKFNNAFYPITHNNPVKNTYNLNKQLLITGPNAAGKTTILKTTLFNILISQQIGYGCYKSATIYPYHKIHCYINIPDTSNRDSLFQAEARRCKNILDNIKDDNIRHFCVFDELFSGTNPYEAISSAVSFLRYLNKYKNVSFIITTHYLDICNKLSNDKKTHNCNMKINKKEDGEFLYTYKLDSGISNVKGGIKVLNDLEYLNLNLTLHLAQYFQILLEGVFEFVLVANGGPEDEGDDLDSYELEINYLGNNIQKPFDVNHFMYWMQMTLYKELIQERNKELLDSMNSETKTFPKELLL